MKTFITEILITILLCNFTIFGQKEIYGTYKASCAGEITKKGLIYCELCPSTNERVSNILPFEITIEEGKIKLNIDNKLSTVDYTWDNELKSLGFKYGEIKYKFKLVFFFDTTTRWLLRDEKGLIIILDKKM